MRCIFLLIFILCHYLPLDAVVWQTDYAEAKNLSKKENKPLLLFFNGSDWAVSAMQMKHEILMAAAFQEKIGEKFICLEIDFPKYSQQTQKLIEQNQELKERFKVQDPPVLFLLDPSERVIAQMSYLPESGLQLALDLVKIVEQDEELISCLQQLKQGASIATNHLKKLYQIALELGSEAAIEQLLEAGRKKNDPYFCLEKYRLLVEKGEMKGNEAIQLRQKLISFDPESEFVNGQKIPFTLAVIDFQALSQKNAPPEEIAKPLIDYLVQFGKDDQKNIWRIEMMISEIYLDADQWEEALKHAEKAYFVAPETMHEEIAHSIDYMRAAKAIR